jgi:hypothetical protein
MAATRRTVTPKAGGGWTVDGGPDRGGLADPRSQRLTDNTSPVFERLTGLCVPRCL